jgi:hypothetical protein
MLNILTFTAHRSSLARVPSDHAKSYRRLVVGTQVRLSQFMFAQLDKNKVYQKNCDGPMQFLVYFMVGDTHSKFTSFELKICIYLA